jgi:hypothetical protein
MDRSLPIWNTTAYRLLGMRLWNSQPNLALVALNNREWVIGGHIRVPLTASYTIASLLKTSSSSSSSTNSTSQAETTAAAGASSAATAITTDYPDAIFSPQPPLAQVTLVDGYGGKHLLRERLARKHAFHALIHPLGVYRSRSHSFPL